jgi:hypothetical protein
MGAKQEPPSIRFTLHYESESIQNERRKLKRRTEQSNKSTVRR